MNVVNAPASGWRLKLGLVMLMASIVIPPAALFLVGSAGFSAAVSATVSGAVLAGSEILGLAAIAVMGKPGYEYLKQRLFGFLERHGPPQRVSRLRYRIGLWLFSTPLLFGWLAPYAGYALPSLNAHAIPLAIAGDVLLVTSLFVLGGDFWDKVRALFLHGAQARFE